MQVTLGSTLPNEAVADLVVLGVGEAIRSELADLDAALGGQLIPWVTARKFTGAEGASLLVPTFGRCASAAILLVGLGKRTERAFRVAAGKVGREARANDAKHVAVSFPGVAGRAAAVVDWIAAGNYAYERYKPASDVTSAIERLDLLGADVSAADLERMAVIDRHRAWARDVVNAAPNDLYPEVLAAEAEKLGALASVTVEVWDVARLEAERCVGVLAVGKGSDRPPRMIKVSYRPENARGKVALVGKGVTFDSGGLSLKPSASMQTMRCDMAGAATVLAAVGAAAELGLPLAIDCWVASVENLVNGISYKLGDVLTYANGVTVEIHNTDAEGRLILADALIHASREPGVTHMIDAATLTGACVLALGPDFTGLFTADDALAAQLATAARAAGEGLWRLPLHAPYKASLKGDWGQIKNIGARDGGASVAASFLEHFVGEDIAWAHLDIAGSAFFEKGEARYAAGATGEPVRTLVHWLESMANG